MKLIDLPYKETLLILLLIILNLSLNNVHLKPKYSELITKNSKIRFVIIFLTAYILFSLDIAGDYTVFTQLIVSFFVAILVQLFMLDNITEIQSESLQNKIIHL